MHVQDLTKRFGGVTAVDDISFAVRAGSSTALLGGNGAGKTTTLALFLGLLLLTAGSIEVLGVNMLRHRYRALPRMCCFDRSLACPSRSSRKCGRVTSGICS